MRPKGGWSHEISNEKNGNTWTFWCFFFTVVLSAGCGNVRLPSQSRIMAAIEQGIWISGTGPSSTTWYLEHNCGRLMMGHLFWSAASLRCLRLFFFLFLCVCLPRVPPPPVFCAVNSPVIDVAAAVIHPVIGWQIKLMVDGTKKDEHPANPFDKFTWIVLAKNED